MSVACSVCETHTAVGRCEQCRSRFYCGAECQQRDWRELEHYAQCAHIGNLLKRTVYDVTTTEFLRTLPKAALQKIQKAANLSATVPSFTTFLRALQESANLDLDTQDKPQAAITKNLHTVFAHLDNSMTGRQKERVQQSIEWQNALTIWTRGPEIKQSPRAEGKERRGPAPTLASGILKDEKKLADQVLPLVLRELLLHQLSSVKATGLGSDGKRRIQGAELSDFAKGEGRNNLAGVPLRAVLKKPRTLEYFDDDDREQFAFANSLPQVLATFSTNDGVLHILDRPLIRPDASRKEAERKKKERDQPLVELPE